MKSPTESLNDAERKLLQEFDQDLGKARLAYAAFVAKDLNRRVIYPAAKTPASEIWQEQFGWFLEFAQESKDQLYPLQPQDVAAWWAVKSGIPPRVIGRVLGHPNGRQVSQICFRISQQLEKHPALLARVQQLHAL